MLGIHDYSREHGCPGNWMQLRINTGKLIDKKPHMTEILILTFISNKNANDMGSDSNHS